VLVRAEPAYASREISRSIAGIRDIQRRILTHMLLHIYWRRDVVEQLGTRWRSLALPVLFCLLLAGGEVAGALAAAHGAGL